MGFFIYKADVAVKAISILIFWAIHWLYKQRTALDGSIDHEELDEDKELDKNEVKAPSPIATMPITSNVAHKQPQTRPLAVAEKPRPSQSTSCAITQYKTTLGRKRTLFRNILLADALMRRKYFIT